MTTKHLVALIPIIGASVLLWGADRNLIGRTNRLFVSGEGRSDLLQRSLFVGNSVIFTNIVISNDYSGTIQIGTNFATVKDLDTWMSILASFRKTPDPWTTNYWPTEALTYTVDVSNGLWFHTNVIDIHRCSEFCTRMRYVENGLTNDFHAAFVSYTVKTNSP